VLRRLAPGKPGLYSWSPQLTDEAARAKLFGAPISSSFNMVGSKANAILQIAHYSNIRVVAMILIVIMCVTTFFTQKQIMRRSGPVEGQAATVQRLMLYGMPMSLFVSGFFFPIGVLCYWVTNNAWTFGQQFFILRKMPPPGSDAAKAKVAGDSPAVDPRTLAPKPGAKPVRVKPARPVAQAAPGTTDAETSPDTTTTADGASSPTGGASSPTGGASPSAGGASRAGQSPPNKAKRKRR
jgi:YidC/Oxa1 family membrane protein insertase